MASPPKIVEPTPARDATSHGIHYTYMFERDKSPTKQLDGLLRAMARYIVWKPV